MENYSIRTVSIEDFSHYDGLKYEYLDEDFVIVNNLEAGGPIREEPLRVDCIFLLSCLEGSMSFEMNNRAFVLNGDDFLIILPNSVLGGLEISSDARFNLVGISTSFLQQMINMEKKMFNLVAYYYKNPVLHAAESNAKYSYFSLYRKLLYSRIHGEQHRYTKKVVHFLLSALFCELVAELSKSVPQEELEQEDVSKFTRGELIFHQFIEKVMADNGIHRSVAYYADVLCYSPKYLSKVVKDYSGRTPLDIINSHAMEHIKRELKHSKKSIKEIAEQFNFSNHSFFGKYVKAALGMSPQQYRNMMKSKN